MAFMLLSQAVGRNAPNRQLDVQAVHRRLMEIGKIPCYASNGAMDAQILAGIESVQRHFMMRPDQVISPNGATLGYLAAWQEKPVQAGVQLPGRLRNAWDLVNPLLPAGSSCTSGFRSADEQRDILHRFFNMQLREDIVAKYGQGAYDAVAKDLLANEGKVLEMVRGVGQQIAAPGASMHQKGKAIDVGGPSVIDDKQVAVIKLVAQAHRDLLSGKVLKERNGCVHFEIV